MKTRAVNILIVSLGFIVVGGALPRSQEYRTVGGEYVPGEGGGSSVGGAAGNALSKEPTCEELRAMWRFSKRQSRAAEITNEIPTYRDPFAYNVWDEYARPRSAGSGRYRGWRKPLVYGRVVHSSSRMHMPVEESPERIRAFEEVARMFGSPMYPAPPVPRRKTSFRVGGGASAFQTPSSQQAGSFQHLKDLIRTERARELEEQRKNEEAERAHVQYGKVHDSPVEIPPNDNKMARGVVAFPDIMIPPATRYMDQYTAIQQQKFKQRYPDTNAW